MQNSRSSLGGSFSQNACGSQGAGSSRNVDNFQATGGSQGVSDFRDWFSGHFSLNGDSYTLDLDQARAVLDNHKNTLVIARAGSGKTRVIVAKIAYLLATKQMRPQEIAAFMFNRTAAAEVNQRIAQVKFDGRPVIQNDPAQTFQIASTFHKFALDLVKLSGACPELISEAEHDRIIEKSLRQALAERKRHIPPNEFDTYLKTISGFVARAGQKYSGRKGLEQLRQAVTKNQNNLELHQLALATFENYLSALCPPKIDFNLMMSEASEIVRQAATTAKANKLPEQTAASLHNQAAISARVAPLKLILIDEYQDFSQLFLNLVQSLRENCPAAHLFAVGDDWQAINRFAGSDVDYFINFADYFPENVAKISLLTNYRSCHRIVENANKYMLKNYDSNASRAIAFNRKPGKVIRVNPEKTRFNAGDINEDALGDARYQIALAVTASLTADANTKAAVQATDVAANLTMNPAKVQPSAAKLLKTVLKVLRQNRHSEIMLLHRHNFTTFPGITLETFHQALKNIVTDEGIMDAETFDRKVRSMTMHKSKGLEAPVVILLEANYDLVLGHHPEADLWQLFGDSLATEKSDQHRLLYVAMTRAKQKLYVLSTDRKSPL